MIVAKFILYWGFLLNNGHSIELSQILITKEYCITQAHIKWDEFYKNEMDKTSSFTAICRNQHNNYDFVKIVCDKSGSCNV